MQKNLYQENRAFPRMSTNLYAKIFYGIDIIKGNVTNLSKNGMCIKSSDKLPTKADSDIIIPLMDDILDIKIKVVRCNETDNNHYEMGVKVLNTPQEYFDFIYDYFKFKNKL